MQQALRRLIYFENPTRYQWLIYFGFFALLHIPAVLHHEGVNAYLLYANSLLKGHISLQADNYDYLDMIFYNGKHYLPYPPFPSLVLLPFAAILGPNVNTILIALICSCANLYLLYKVFLKLEISKPIKSLLIPAFFFGTGYWYVLVTSHHVYQFAHIIATTLILLSINEILGKQRWWLVGIFIGCSFLTRQFTLFYGVFALGYLYYINKDKLDGNFYRKAVSLCGSILVFVGLYLVYNYVRFGQPLNAGYNYIEYAGILKDRVATYGVFSLRYFWFNFYSLFVKGFTIIIDGPDRLKIVDIDLWGTSLTAASPFLIASVKANWPKKLLWVSWITILIMLTGILFYHNNGFSQVNCMRFTLDFLPLLFILTALGANSIPRWLLRIMVIYACVLNVAAFVIHYMAQ
ncbi:hypothetical protein [Pinibacter aurantiacus]|uniref:Uncharacterized protein n=1 Tax=Pinibacter aurantiacus TaxID=2851599 RepID=A0A9E2W4I4_9BACT|nr:hypothetical protein [Pinibacter aurantiacus]MBV4359790.1 hypothetical protein [Pinibacter aurantiacus]